MIYGFISPLRTDLIDDCYWRLVSPLVYNSKQFGTIMVPAEFETDLASVPRIPIIYELWGNRAHREAVLHDFVYCYDSEPHLSFMDANGLFLEAMNSRNVPVHIRYPMYTGVCVCGLRFFGKRSFKDKLSCTNAQCFEPDGDSQN
jgi:hypothetical protein